MVGFTVDPDQWCRHDRGQAWPGSSATYRHLPHHRTAGGARPEPAGRLPGSEPGAGPLPSTPRTLRLSGPRRGRPSGEHGKAGGRVSHWGERSSHSYPVTLVFLDILANRCRDLVDASSFGPCFVPDTVQLQRRWCMVWRTAVMRSVVMLCSLLRYSVWYQIMGLQGRRCIMCSKLRQTAPADPYRRWPWWSPAALSDWASLEAATMPATRLALMNLGSSSQRYHVGGGIIVKHVAVSQDQK